MVFSNLGERRRVGRREERLAAGAALGGERVGDDVLEALARVIIDERDRGEHDGADARRPAEVAGNARVHGLVAEHLREHGQEVRLARAEVALQERSRSPRAAPRAPRKTSRMCAASAVRKKPVDQSRPSAGS